MNRFDWNRMNLSKSVPRFQTSDSSSSLPRSKSDSEWKDTWISAALRAKVAKDPWAQHDIPANCVTERAFRYRYDALEKKWLKDEIEVKMQAEVSHLPCFYNGMVLSLDNFLHAAKDAFFEQPTIAVIPW